MAESKGLGVVIADRTYEWRDAKRSGTLKVLIGTARRDKRPGGDWFCPVQFMGAPRGYGLSSAVRPVYGFDRLQALTLALGYVHANLANVPRTLRLTWLDANDLGLPDILGLIGVRRSFRRPPRR